MEERIKIIIAVLLMILTIVSMVFYANTEGKIKMVFLILTSAMIGIFWNKKIL